jgi:hypothetical protein
MVGCKRAASAADLKLRPSRKDKGCGMLEYPCLQRVGTSSLAGSLQDPQAAFLRLSGCSGAGFGGKEGRDAVTIAACFQYLA